tara:strand:+ start:250 stop:1032 length:783 start_codon:yes stop_codon:yes gene_type:complete
MVTKQEIFMPPNNLNKMIETSGERGPKLNKRQVAELKGIKPPTVSRHISGEIGISLGDAEEYAKILNCTPQHIFFQFEPVPVLGVVKLSSQCGWTAEQFALLKQEKKPQLVVCHHFKRPEMKHYQNKAIYVHDYYDPNTMAVYWDVNDFDDGRVVSAGAWQHGMLEMVDIAGAVNKEVNPDSFGNYCYCMTKEGVLLYGMLYQSSHKTYKLTSNAFGTHDDIELQWACPVINMILRNKVRQVEWVDHHVSFHIQDKFVPE